MFIYKCVVCLNYVTMNLVLNQRDVVVGEKSDPFAESDDDFDPRGNDTVINNNVRNVTSDATLGNLDIQTCCLINVSVLTLFFLVFPLTLQPNSVKHLQEATSETLSNEKDIFGAEPFGDNSLTDPFGMADFGRVVSQSDQEMNLNGVMNRRITEMQEGFTRGISFEGDDFDLESLDPLRLQKTLFLLK